MDPVEAALFAVPPPPKGAVRRVRLQQRLDDGVKGPLTLVTAPAGTGKTVLVSSWISGLHGSHTVVWLSLDDSTVGPATFWHSVVSSLARRGVDVPPPISTGPDAGDVSFTSSIASRVRAHPEPVVLVLDCDGALPRDVGSKLDAFIRLSRGQLRVVLLTREDPLLPLHRYRLAGTLVELRMADLAFTPDEAEQMLRGLGVHLSSSAMDAIISRTQGWAAGLRMAAMSLAHRADREEATLRLAGDTGTVAEYLLAEVLDTQPVALRQLLLDTSVVDILRPGLAAALAGPHADRALSFLVHGNAFLTELPESPGCYRYHHLFRELLRAQLAYESPERSVELHRVAATWLADHGHVVDAVRHAIVTRDWDAAARFAVDDLSITALLAARPTEALTEALARIPKTTEGTAVSIIAAARAVASRDRRAASAIRRAQRSLADPASESWPAGELAVQVLRLVHARQTGDAGAALDSAAAARVLMHVQDRGRLVAHPELDALIESNRGAALVLGGHLDDAADAFAAAAATVHVAGRDGPLIDALGHGALLAALRGDLRKSTDLAVRAVRLCSAAGLTPDWCPGAAEVALTYVHTERYDIGGGRDHAALAARCDLTAGDPLPAAMLALAQARICVAGGDLEGALAILDEPVDLLPGWLAHRLGAERAAMLVASGEATDAGDVDAPTLLSSVQLSSAEESPPSAKVDALLRSATRYLGSGSRQRAVREVDHALRIAAPEMSRRAFRAAPHELWRLIEQNDGLMSRHAWLTNDPAAGPATGLIPRPRHALIDLTGTDRTESSDQQIFEPLTDKEREVLGHLSELLTTDEIAAVMFISVNTVRTHVRNILRKLAASRRNEAVRRARVLKIIPG